MACARAAFVLVVLMAIAFAGGCIPAQAVKQCETQQAIFMGITRRTNVQPEAHDVAAAAHDGFAALLYSLKGTPLPRETVVRLRDRGLLPEDYPE
jgi:hypothetical protein